MEKDVVDSGKEHEVEVGFALRKRGAEMLGKPCKGLRRGVLLARNVGGGRSILEHRDVGEVLLGEAFVLAKSTDAEIAESEAFTFGNIDGGIDIKQVGRAAVCLIACDAVVAMCPISPLGGEILQEEVAKRFAVVADDTAVGICAEGVFLI